MGRKPTKGSPLDFVKSQYLNVQVEQRRALSRLAAPGRMRAGRFSLPRESRPPMCHLHLPSSKRVPIPRLSSAPRSESEKLNCERDQQGLVCGLDLAVSSPADAHPSRQVFHVSLAPKVRLPHLLSQFGVTAVCIAVSVVLISRAA